MDDFKLDGFIPATFTPMKANGDVDYDKIEDYCQFLVDEGVTSLFIHGSTGEGPSLTVEERMRLTECWVKAGRKEGRSMKLVVQVGGACLTDSIAMAKHSEEHGVDAIATLPPLYYLASSPSDLVQHCRVIGAAAPRTPLYYYHIPSRSNTYLDMENFLLEARDVIPTLRGMKFSDKDVVMMTACLRTLDSKGRNYNILFGVDEQVMSALVLGADGAIGTTYNWMSGLYRRMAALMDKNDFRSARTEQYRSQDVIKEVYKFGVKTNGIISPFKHVMQLVGLDLGPVRPPMRAMETEDREAFFKVLLDMGFLDWRK